MLKYNEKEGYLHLYVNDASPEYFIALDELGKTANWNLFQLGSNEDRLIPNVSGWVLHLRSKAYGTTDFLIELGELIKQRVPSNKIDWQAAYKAVEIVNEYRSRTVSDASNTNGIHRINFKKMPERIDKKRAVAQQLIEKFNL